MGLPQGEALTITTSVSGLTASLTVHARSVYLQVFGGPIRWYADGRTPNSTTGFVMSDFGIIELRSQIEAREFKAIRDSTATADATIEVWYRKCDPRD